jgi:phosphoribosylformylglycinamidine cyclo-ligase
MTDGAPLTLHNAGVSRPLADELIARVLPRMRTTDRDRRLIPVPGFAGALALEHGGDALVLTTDGVGTKRVLMLERMRDLGRDLVATNVNDVTALGARPLAFLDYLSCGRLELSWAVELLEGVADACLDAGCVLVGGETAEHPGVQRPDDLDLAGFAVGICPRDRLVTGAGVRAGDVVIGLASSGPHASGFSLIRHVFDRSGRPVPASFLEPTVLYGAAVAALRDTVEVLAIANICDGGLTENVPRAFSGALGAVVDPGAWPVPGWVRELVAMGCEPAELRRSVNVGIGYTVVVRRGQAGAALGAVRSAGYTAWEIGEVISAEPAGERVRYV